MNMLNIDTVHTTRMDRAFNELVRKSEHMDTGDYQQLLDYKRKIGTMTVTVGICPSCARREACPVRRWYKANPDVKQIVIDCGCYLNTSRPWQLGGKEV